MELQTLLCIAFLLHCTQQTGIFLHSYWNRNSDEINGPNDVIDDKIDQWNIAKKLRFSDENTKISDEEYANSMNNLFINTQNDTKNILMVLTRIENLINQNAVSVVRYNNILEEWKEINNTIHSIWNEVESMLGVIEETLEWINDGVKNKSEQLNVINQGAQHIFYLLSVMIVAAFLQAPFVTRVAIILIVPLNIKAFSKHGKMEDCLGFTSITFLICFITAVNFLMQKENLMQSKIARFVILTESRIFGHLTPLNATERFFAVLKKILIILKDSMKRYWQISANWFRRQNLAHDTKTSDPEIENSKEKKELPMDQLVSSKDGENCPNADPVNATHETHGCDPKKRIAVVGKSQSDLPSEQVDPAEHTSEVEKNLEESFVPKEPSGSTSVQPVMESDQIRDEAPEKLVVQFPSPPEDRTEHVNRSRPVEIAKVTPNVTQKKPTESSSIEYDLPAYCPLEKQREKATTDYPSMLDDQAKDTSNAGDSPQQTQPIIHRVARIEPRSYQTSSYTPPPIPPPIRNTNPSTVSGLLQAQNHCSLVEDLQSILCSTIEPSQTEARQVSRNDKADLNTSPGLNFTCGPSGSFGLCGAMTQQGTPCRNKPSYGGSLCWRHGSSGSSGICGAMTQRGTPCRNKPSYGGSRCWRH